MSKKTNNRKPIPKSVRFEVLKRDSFSCQYCGSSAPSAVLHIDHIKPISKGGDNDIMNLVAACSDCNLGKSNIELDDKSAINAKKRQLDEINARREQIEMMMDWQRELRDLDSLVLDSIVELVNDQMLGREVNDHGLKSIKKWVKKHKYNILCESIEAAADQYLDIGDDGKHTQDSCAKYLSLIPRIAANKERYGDDKDIQKLFYARGILRNRVRVYNEHVALDLLKSAYEVTGDADALIDMAKSASSWASFKRDIEDLVTQLEESCEALS